jgi:hypothetical protein
MQIVRFAVIDCHIDDVFEYAADPLNDPAWCATVLVVDQVEGDGPGPGARYEMLHRPLRWRPPRAAQRTCVAWDPPGQIAWRLESGGEVAD